MYVSMRLGDLGSSKFLTCMQQTHKPGFIAEDGQNVCDKGDELEAFGWGRSLCLHVEGQTGQNLF